jgi:enoyl-CoA hydratase/carnithine racemase
MDLVLSESQDGVRLLTLNRPEKKNAFVLDMWKALEQALVAARNDDSVAVVVLTGAGADFSAGVDLGSFGEPFEGPHPFQTAMEELYTFDKPLLAAVRGVGVGFGATCLFHCDIVYVGQSVRLRLPFVNLGLVPEAASSYTLQTVIGYQRAAELFFTAQWIDAAKAVETGIALESFADGEVLERTLGKAREIASFPVRALQATKRTLRAPHLDAIRAAHAAEQAGMAEQAGSPENIEAVTAFMQKRKPDFRNLPPRR